MLFADVRVSPSPSSLPGSAALQTLVNGIAGWALILTLAALIIGAVVWAVGSHTQNMHHSMAGRRVAINLGYTEWVRGGAMVSFVAE